jgi:CheY-like chemotaxis protein
VARASRQAYIFTCSNGNQNSYSFNKATSVIHSDHGEWATVILRGREILVAEDVRFTRLAIVKILSQMGAAKVHEAEDGAVALALLEEHGASIDCVLTDLDMPNVNGLQLLKAVRVGTGNVNRQMKVVALTGQTELGLLGPALLLDIEAIIVKPTSKEALEKCFERLFASDAVLVDAGVDVYRAVILPPLGDMTSASVAPAGGVDHEVSGGSSPIPSIRAAP